MDAEEPGSDSIQPSKDSKHIYVRTSSIHNKGGFAYTNIKKGTQLLEYTGEPVIEDSDAEERLARDMELGETYLFLIDEDTLIDGSKYGSDARFINHSCAPNCEFVIKNKRIYVHAIKDIKQHEELTVDYNFDPDMGKLNGICLCGKPECRGYIVGKSDLHELINILNELKENDTINPLTSASKMSKEMPAINTAFQSNIMTNKF